MKIATNYSVLLIDNKYEEVLPVIKSLAQRGISTIYWDGAIETKPINPLNGVRFVFLDMRFSEVTDARTIITFLFTLIRTSIDINNGPYILFIWSKHDNEYLEAFKAEFNEVKGVPKPYLIVNMEKSKFITWEYQRNQVYDEIAATLENEENEAMKKVILEILKNSNISDTNEIITIKEDGTDDIINSLDEKLKEVNSLNILLMWETLVNFSARGLVNNIASISDLNKDWDNNIKSLVQNLAIANAGKSLGDSSKEYIINALLAFNQMLPDELLNQLMNAEVDEETFVFIKNPSIVKTVDENDYSITKTSKRFIIKKNNADYKSFRYLSDIVDDADAKLFTELYKMYLEQQGKNNFKLLCENIGLNEIKKPGGVYSANDDKLLASIGDSIFKNVELKSGGQALVYLDISSSCDYAQNKLKRARILPGIMLEEELFSCIDDTEDVYCTPALFINGKIVRIAFNFHYITNIDTSCLIGESKMFSVRELLLSEIKHKLTSYISRIGIINL